MKRIIIVMVLYATVLMSCGKRSFEISNNTIHGLCIVTDVKPSNAANFAACELQYHIRKVTGISLPIFKGEIPANMTPVYVGVSSLIPKTEQHLLQFGEQEYLIRITDRYIILAGRDDASEQKEDKGEVDILYSKNSARDIDYAAATGEKYSSKVTIPGLYEQQGTCYAVYDFLERYFGIGWYGPHPDNVVIPQQDSIVLASTTIKRSPAFKYRYSTPLQGEQMNKSLFFDATSDMYLLYERRMRLGGEKWAANHSFTGYPERFLSKDSTVTPLHEEYHPEYFAKETSANYAQNGFKKEFQLCYTNSGLIEQVTNDANRFFEGKGLKEKQIGIGRYFAMVPGDNPNWCSCDQCQSLLEKDKTYKKGEFFGSGLASGYWFSFVNSIAKRIKVSHPDKMLATLAYWQYSYLPKDITLESNVSVGLCLHPRNYWATGTHKNEMFFYRQWIDEAKKSKRPLYVWNYYCFPSETGAVQNFGVFPGFSAHLEAKQIKMYASDSVRGVFLCGSGEQLDYYLSMKLYDNPAANGDSLISSFFKSYFGKAAEPMKRFYSTIENRFNDTKSYPLSVRTEAKLFQQTEEMAWKYLGTDSVMTVLHKAISQAEAMASTPIEQKRVDAWKKGIWDYMVNGRKRYLNKSAKAISKVQ